MQENTYNGWTNYETWLVKLWMDNDEGSDRFWSEEAETSYRNARADSIFSKSEKAKMALADSLKENHEEVIYSAIPKPLHASFIMDLLNGAMSEVNWHEIAESLLETHCEDYGKEPVTESGVQP